MLPGARHSYISQTPLAGLLRLEAIHAQQEDMGKIQTFGAVELGERCYWQHVSGSA